MAYARGRSTNTRRRRFISRGVKSRARTVKSRRSMRGRRGYTRRALIASGFGKTKTVKLRFCQKFTLNPGTQTFVTKVFSANGLYDPDSEVVFGESVSMFNTYMSLYNHYQVMYSKCTVHEDPLFNSSAGVPCHYGILLADQPSHIPNQIQTFEQLMEQPAYTKSAMRRVGFRDNTMINKYTRTTKSVNIRKFLGNADASIRRGGISSNPSEQCYFIIWAISNSVNDPESFAFYVTIDFIVRFTEPKARPTN